MKSFLKVILSRVLVFFVGIVLVLSFFNLDVNAKLPNIITKHPNPVNPDREDPITVFFHYGNPSYDKQIKNATAEVEIKGSGLKILPGSVSDLYHIERENNRPKIPSCNESYDGPEYEVDGTLVSEDGFRYGLQTAIKQDAPSGEEIGTLEPYSTGCIRFKVVVDNADSGDLAEIIFNQDVNLSDGYDSVNRPGKQIIKIRFAKGGECSEDKEFVLGSCVNPCKENEVRNLLGSCEILKDICEDGYEKFGDLCVEKCKEGEIRGGFGDCVSEEEVKSPFDDAELAGICLTEDCEGEEEATFEDALILISTVAVIVILLGFLLKVFALIRSKED